MEKAQGPIELAQPPKFPIPKPSSRSRPHGIPPPVLLAPSNPRRRPDRRPDRRRSPSRRAAGPPPPAPALLSACGLQSADLPSMRCGLRRYLQPRSRPAQPRRRRAPEPRCCGSAPCPADLRCGARRASACLPGPRPRPGASRRTSRGAPPPSRRAPERPAL